MKKMQKRYLIFLYSFFFIFSAAVLPAAAQTSSFRLSTADSLFAAKRYTQSLERYEGILQNNEYTPAMLLRMAYIHEGLENTGEALYYLNLYYLVSNDPSVLQKMDELAARDNLQGYDATDTDTFLTWYYDYHTEITFSLAAICLFFFALSFYLRSKKNRRPVVAFVMLIVFALAALIHLYEGEKTPVGIITNAETYVMNGPSSGANVVDIVKAGHRIEVIDKKDVWFEVRWNNSTGYIRENSLRPVTLIGS